ncbi:hypothetical protein PG996_002326 [Apiospora saccharicola]|uniref:Uncharacterized protein n=1 Tax=Apiospora saccharicola TaxID=335842 RepID=A0ABR1WJ51_9PEZI
MCYSEELGTVCSECRSSPTRRPQRLQHKCFDVLKHKKRYGACGRASERPFTTIVRSGVCRSCRIGSSGGRSGRSGSGSSSRATDPLLQRPPYYRRRDDDDDDDDDDDGPPRGPTRSRTSVDG